jgi:integrase
MKVAHRLFADPLPNRAREEAAPDNLSFFVTFNKAKALPGGKPGCHKVPFTDDELHNIIAACDRLGEITWQSGNRTGTWNGEEAKDFIWTPTYTGLRISDVALFDMNRLKRNKVFLRGRKTAAKCSPAFPTGCAIDCGHGRKASGSIRFSAAGSPGWKALRIYGGAKPIASSTSRGNS